MENSAESNSRLRNCTVVGNYAHEGGGLSNRSPEGSSNAQLTNCIIWGNRDSSGAVASAQIYGGTTYVRYSCIQGGWPGRGNINTDPCFTAQGYWADANDPNRSIDPNDPNAVWVHGDYHLKSQAGRWEPATQTWIVDDVTSPCIDAGDPKGPIGFEPFPNGGIINMGAYGGTAEASKSYFGEPLCETVVAGDINGDCRVDYNDLAIMAFHWLDPVSTINSACIVQEGIRSYMQTDKSIYRLGENVEMLFRVRNLTAEELRLGCLRWPALDFWVEKDEETIWRVNFGPYIEFGALILAPGESTDRHCNTLFSWNMRDGGGELVEPGMYHVFGKMWCDRVSQVVVPITLIP